MEIELVKNSPPPVCRSVTDLEVGRANVTSDGRIIRLRIGRRYFLSIDTKTGEIACHDEVGVFQAPLPVVESGSKIIITVR